MKVVCLGDSITAGQHVQPGEAWPDVLADATGWHVINKGVPGDTTRLALERFPRDVQDVKPDALIIQFGLNDCNRWETDRWLPRVSAPAFEANLTEMVSRARCFGASPIVVCGLTPTRKSHQHILDALHYNWLAQIAASTVRFYRPGLTDRHLLDDVHPTPEGHQLFAEGVLTCLPSLAVAA
jgi:acyl-CoA thioesterase-1